MKKQVLLVLALLLNSLMFAQGGGFNYKALIANGGSALSNQTVNIKFTVLENGTTNVYQETQSATTDANGIVSVIVGEGTSTDDFTTIDWGSNPYFLKVEIDSGSGYQDFGTNELKSVPYAKFAEKAGNTFSGNFNDLNNIPSGLADGDNDTHLTEAQVDNYVANNGYLTNVHSNTSLSGDGTSGSPLAVNTSSTAFSGWDKNASDDFSGSFTDLTNVPSGLSDGDDDTHLTEAQVDNYVANNGYLTNVHSNTSLSGDGTSGSPLAVNTSSTAFSGWDKNASDDFSGNYSDLNGAPTNVSSFTNDAGYLTNATLPDQTDADFYKEGTTTQATDINDDIYTMGNVAIGKNTAGYPLDIATNTSNRGINLELSTSGAARHYGVHNSLSGIGTGIQIGVKNKITNSGDANHFGSYSHLNGSGSGYHYGSYNQLSGDGTGAQYGTNNFITNSGNAYHVGTQNYLTGTGTGNKYGTYNKILITAGGTHYAVYGEAEKSGSYAGYFKGDVQITRKLKADDSGDADMKAYIYGAVSSSGNYSYFGAHSDGFSVSRTGTGLYKITFTNSPGGAGAYTVMTNMRNGHVGFITVENYGSYFYIKTYDTSGNSANKAFNFVVYKK